MTEPGACKTAIDELRALEHPTLKVPYETLNKKFRIAQKNIDREVSHVQNVTGDLEKVLLQRGPCVGDVAKLLDNVVEKLGVLKRKSDENICDELDAAKICKKRVDHLKDYANPQANVAQQWRRRRLDRMLVEYFLRAGYYQTALKLAKHSDIQDYTNIDLFVAAKEVEESLAKHETLKCLTWCYENRSKLRRIKSTLEFNLRQQEFIEMIKEEKRLEAVHHARKYFTTAESDQMEDIQKVMALLAFPSNTNLPTYSKLLDDKQWDLLIEQFRQENYKIHQLNSYSVFQVCLQAGLSALKTPNCYSKGDDKRNSDCPVCTVPLNTLAKPLPNAHSSHSRLICSISGEPMNECNPPLMFPNGHCYGQNAIQLNCAENGGKFICPSTGDVFRPEEAEKVFVM